MRNIGINFLVKIPIHYWDINKKRQGITFFDAPCRATLFMLQMMLPLCQTGQPLCHSMLLRFMHDLPWPQAIPPSSSSSRRRSSAGITASTCVDVNSSANQTHLQHQHNTSLSQISRLYSICDDAQCWDTTGLFIHLYTSYVCSTTSKHSATYRLEN